MNVSQFYNNFHKRSIIQKKLINENNFTYRISIRIIREVLKNLDRKNEDISICDFGCGVGTLDFYFASKGYRVMGLDISDKAINVARKSNEVMKLNSKVEFYNSKDINKRVKNKKFNVILCLEVIEHVQKDMELIKYLINKLTNGGYLIISTPTVNAPLYRFKLIKKFDEEVGHLRRYNPEKLVEYFINLHDVKVIKIVKTEGILRNAFFVLKPFTYFGKFIRGFIADVTTYIDRLLITLFGESNIYIIVQKK